MKSPKEVRRAVVSAMKAVQKKGWEIRRGLTVRADSEEAIKGKCCPMFAVLLDKSPRSAKTFAVSQRVYASIMGIPKSKHLSPSDYADVLVRISKRVGIPPYAVEAFMAGYDREPKVVWGDEDWADAHGWACKTLTAAQVNVAKKFYALGKSL